MNEFMQFLIEHGYQLIFVWVALDQAGLPLPAIPLILAAGALAGMGEMSLPLIVIASLIASLPIDLFWYWLGRARGGKVLNLLCSISLEPDYCVRNTEQTFNRLGVFSLLIAKFVPGMQTLAPPMAGMTRMNIGLFLFLDGLGTVIWTLTFAGAGFWFHNELEYLATKFAELGLLAGFILLSVLVLYIGNKFVQRRVFLASLRMRRLEPAEVNELLTSGKDVHVIDLRHNHDFDARPQMVPTAVRVPMETIEHHLHRIPKDDNIIVYCS
jgi:membrane protein DedA with SNARE-associated domain